MHETAFVKEIIKQVKDSENVDSIELEVGELASISPEHLKEHLKAITGWKVIAKEMPSNVKCACGYAGRAKIIEKSHDILIYNCPNCSSLPECISGDEIKLKKVIYR